MQSCLWAAVLRNLMDAYPQQRQIIIPRRSVTQRALRVYPWKRLTDGGLTSTLRRTGAQGGEIR